MKKFLLFLFLFFSAFQILKSQNAWINEFHYDNASSDTGEFVEIVIENAGSYSLSDFRLDLYNGSGGTSYEHQTLDQFASGSTYGHFTIYYLDISGIQNGAPDGIALSYQDRLLAGQFISYEGSFTATDGPANGQTSSDIGTSETTSTTKGFSLQLSGNGSQYSDFSWQVPDTATKGHINNEQTLLSTGINNPGNFTATASSPSEINLSWTQNTNSDNVMIACNTENRFGSPADGSAYSADDTLTGGGTVIYISDGTTYTHGGLTPQTTYYYKAWSVDNAHQYSSGISNNTTTYKNEPSQQATALAVGSPKTSSLSLSWNDNDGTTVADAYLIQVNTTGTFSAPVDGTPQDDDTDLSDAVGQVNVNHGTEVYTFHNLNSGTTYYFKIWAYTNSGNAINFKTDGTVPTAHATTTPPAPEPQAGELFITEIVGDAADDTNDDGYMEVYNAADHEISLDQVAARYFNSNPGDPTKVVTLNGSILPGEFIMISQDSISFRNHFGYPADFTGSTFYFNGGDDGCDLYHTDLGILDQFNDNGTDQSPWTWDDTYAWERNTTSGGAVQAHWTKRSAATPKSFGTATWTGDLSSDWNADDNWTFITPTATMDVSVPPVSSHTLSIESEAGSPAVCNNLTIEPGGFLTIPSGKGLNVSGTLTVASDSTGNGSLIADGTLTGNIVIQHYVKGYESSSDGWHLIASPVDSHDITASDFEPGNVSPNLDDLFFWEETTGSWLNSKDTSNHINCFINGKGYLVAYEATETKSFAGNPNQDDILFNNLSYHPSEGNGWHLLGNPYPSALSWGDNNWSMTNVSGVAKVWNSAAANYTDLSSGEIIPAGNGFFIQVQDASNSITIPASNRMHQDVNSYKEQMQNTDQLTFKITGDSNSYYDESTLGFTPEATFDFDLRYDSHKLFSLVETAPQIWSVVEKVSYSTNYLPVTDSLQIPLYCKVGVESVYHLTWEGALDFSPNDQLILEDRKKHQNTDMRKTLQYDFTAGKEDMQNRFVIHLTDVTTGISDIEPSRAFRIFAKDKAVHIQSDESLSGIISFFNLKGQRVYTTQCTRKKSLVLHPHLNPGIYIIQIKTSNKMKITQKLILQ